MPLLKNSVLTDSDRRVRQADRLARILRVLRMIESPARWNADRLAEELEVSRRTVMRDIKVLEFAGVPIFFDRNRSSYEVRSDYRFAVPKLTPDEIIGQTIAAAVTRATGIDVTGAAASAASKLAASATEEDQQLFADARAVLDALSLQFVDHTGHEATIQTCQQSLLANRCLTSVYRSPYQQDSVRLTLNPIRLCLIKHALYLIAIPDGASEPRTYRITRFQSVEMTERPARAIEDFDLRAYLANAWTVLRGGETHEVAIRFSSIAAKIVTETIWHRTQRVESHDNGNVILRFTVDGLDEILEWLLTWTGQAEVLAPPQLRSMLAQRLQAGLRLNGSTHSL